MFPYIFAVPVVSVVRGGSGATDSFVVVGTGLVATVTAIVNYFSGQLRLPSRAGLLVAAGAAVFAPLAPMTVAVQTLATLTIVALLYIEVKYDSGSETGQPEQAAVDD